MLTGDVKTVEFNKDSIIEAASLDNNAFNLTPSKQDSILREKVDKEDKYNLFESATTGSNFVLFPPANGTISEDYNVKEKHFAVDIVIAKRHSSKSHSRWNCNFCRMDCRNRICHHYRAQ